ncbi:MAG: hypothetical protein RL316_1393 [Bacteroidota bacterium]
MYLVSVINTTTMKFTEYKIHIIYPGERDFHFVQTTRHSAEEMLELIFQQWNKESGQGSKKFLEYKTHSISVHDIVGINGKYYQRVLSGWEEMTLDQVKILQLEISNHPMRYVIGPRPTLHEIMRARDRKKTTEETSLVNK